MFGLKHFKLVKKEDLEGKISEELLERLPDQPETILNMIFLAKEAENLSLEESLERIKIYPNQKPKIKTKE